MSTKNPHSNLPFEGNPRPNYLFRNLLQSNSYVELCTLFEKPPIHPLLVKNLCNLIVAPTPPPSHRTIQKKNLLQGLYLPEFLVFSYFSPFSIPGQKKIHTRTAKKRAQMSQFITATKDCIDAKITTLGSRRGWRGRRGLPPPGRRRKSRCRPAE